MLLAIVLAIVSGGVSADVEVRARGLFKNGAMLEINGAQKLLKVGQRSDEGVLLVEANSKFAVIEVEGKRRQLKLSRQIGTQFVQPDKAEVRLPSRSGGHYWATGRINGRAVEMMVDTGATSIALSSDQAKALGLRYQKSTPGNVSTASGVAKAWPVMLDSVSVGAIKLHKVEAVVIDGSFPAMILLGNSFLKRVDLEREQGVMVLKARY